MLFQKKGLPEEGELLLCTITKIQPNSVFVGLDEYGLSGMIHISEISPGRIRNLRDFVKEGKKVVCVVLRVNRERGYIDLSLRRVNEAQKKKKIEYIKQQQKAEKIVEFVAQNNKMETAVYFNEILEKVKNDYGDLVSFFNDIVNNPETRSYGIKFEDQLVEVVKQRIKPPEVELEGVFKIEIFADNGIGIIQQAFAKLPPKVASCYLGGGQYHVSIKAPDYKEAEDLLDPSKDKILEFLEENGASVSYSRINKKK